MFKDKKILGIIPARGGSKGIKDKNIINLAGKPLIAYSIECGLNSKYIDDVVVTTDSEKIAKVAKEYGAKVPFSRPSELAQDTTSTAAAITHALNKLKELGSEYDDVVLLQPTQPLRTVEDLDNSIELYMEKGRQGLISVSPVQETPILMFSMKDGVFTKLVEHKGNIRRQDLPSYYKVNGCIYINRTEDMNEDFAYVSEAKVHFVMEQSHSVDIDEPVDLVVAEYYINRENS